ncbi:MAG: PAS domain S-box protein [Fibrobacter sp.]|nr:PAS domain S-box protein [Fibrobacter sp.]
MYDKNINDVEKSPYDELFRQIFKTTPLAYVVIDITGNTIIDVNNSFTAISGYKRDELVNKPADTLTILMKDSDFDFIQDNVSDCYSNKSTKKNIKCKNGETKTVLVMKETIVLEQKTYFLLTIEDITNRINAEMKLRESENRLRTLSDKLPGGMVYELDIGEDGKDRKFLYVSEGVRTLHGISPEEALKDSSLVFNHIVKDDLSVVSENEDAALKNMGVFKAETRVRMPSGEIRHRLTISTLRRLSNNHIVSDGLEIDITDRKRNENLLALEHSLAIQLNNANSTQAWLKLCLDAAINASEMDCGAIYLVNEHDKSLSLAVHQGVTEEFTAATTNYDATSMNTQIVLDGHPVYIAYDNINTFGSFPDNEKIRTLGVIPVTHENHVIGCMNIGSHVRDDIPAYARTVLETIASRVGSSIVQLKTEEALRESEEKHRSIVEQFSEGLILTDENGQILEWNNACEKISGIERAAVLGRTIWDLSDDIIPQEFNTPKNRAKIENTVSQFCNPGVSEVMNKVAEGIFIRADGQNRNFRQTMFRIPNKNSFLFASILEDTTERKKTEETIQKSQRLESLGILAGGIAHDFNNLLGGIYGYIDLAYSETRDEKACKYLKSTLSTIDRARALTTQLLTFAKGGSPIRDVSALVPLLQETVEFALRGSNCNAAFTIDKNLWQCNIDKNQISQVIENITINAQQAMPGGGTIEISAENITLNDSVHPLLSSGNYVKVSIKDNGTGIAKNVLPHIFDPFYSTKPKGYGLGLATSYSIITRHDGCIEVDSEVDQGSTFHLYLPATPESTAVLPTQTNRHTGSGVFIIVDDEEVVRNTTSSMLKLMGYSTVCISEGRTALDYYEKERNAGHPVTAFIVDLTIPAGMGGKEIVNEIRKFNSSIPVFAMSGYADDAVMTDPSEYGFTASIAKPFMIVQLSAMLDRTLSNSNKIALNPT